MFRKYMYLHTWTNVMQEKHLWFNVSSEPDTEKSLIFESNLFKHFFPWFLKLEKTIIGFNWTFFQIIKKQENRSNPFQEEPQKINKV